MFARTALLMAFLTGIFLVVGYLLAGTAGMAGALFLAFIMNFLAYWFSDKIVLMMYGAKEIPHSQEPKLHAIVERLAKEAKIPKPKIYLVKTNVANAFATGRSPKNAVVAVTSGLLDNLEWDEIEGVIGHELSHVTNRDTLTATIAATIGGAVGFLAQMAWYSLMWGGGNRGHRSGGNVLMLPLLLLAPLAATLVQLAISRSREYAADKSGVLLTKKPLSLASALEKISSIASRHPMHGNPAHSHLWIVNPFKGDSMLSLFMTHPPVTERVKRLKELAREI